MADTSSLRKFSDDPDAPDIHPWAVLGSHITLRFMQVLGVVPIITAPLTFKFIWGIKANESFAPLMRTAARGVAAGAVIGLAACAYHMNRLDADGAADRAYRLWFNEGQNRVNRGGMIGAAVGGIAIPLFVSGQQPLGSVPKPAPTALLRTAAQGACLGLVLGTVSAVALEATTRFVVKYSSRTELSKPPSS